jgi:mono/diheme cytochrome c family protein
MKYLKILVAVFLLAASSCSKKTAPATVTDVKPVIDGKKMYAQSCARCHGATGVEGGAPNLALFTPGTERIAEIIANGKGRMPSFKDDYSAEEIAAIAGYVNGFKTK